MKKKMKKVIIENAIKEEDLILEDKVVSITEATESTKISGKINKNIRERKYKNIGSRLIPF
jgi:hypothetical protein